MAGKHTMGLAEQTGYEQTYSIIAHRRKGGIHDSPGNSGKKNIHADQL